MKHNTQLADIERQEILRREDALSRINDKLEELRTKHRSVETVLVNQVNFVPKFVTERKYIKLRITTISIELFLFVIYKS